MVVTGHAAQANEADEMGFGVVVLVVVNIVVFVVAVVVVVVYDVVVVLVVLLVLLLLQLFYSRCCFSGIGAVVEKSACDLLIF